MAFFVTTFLLAFLPEHISAEEVFTQGYNGGGWSSLGLATLVGIASPLWCFIGPDAGAHMVILVTLADVELQPTDSAAV